MAIVSKINELDGAGLAWRSEWSYPVGQRLKCKVGPVVMAMEIVRCDRLKDGLYEIRGTLRLGEYDNMTGPFIRQVEGGDE